MLRFLLVTFLFTLVPKSAYAYLGLELGNPQVRYEQNTSGDPESFINSPTFDWKIFYQYNSMSRWTWGISYHSQTVDLSGGNDGTTFDETDFNRSRFTAYIARGSKRGFFGQIGFHETKTPYFYENANVVFGEQKTRLDLFIKAGLYYKTGFGGGELTLKFVELPGVEVNGGDIDGFGTEFYFSIYLNKLQNFGFFFHYINEFEDGAFEHVYDSRSLGIVVRI